MKWLHGLLRRDPAEVWLHHQDTVGKKVVLALDLTTQPDKVHYVPHHAVIWQRQGNYKVTNRYDASATAT